MGHRRMQIYARNGCQLGDNRPNRAFCIGDELDRDQGVNTSCTRLSRSALVRVTAVTSAPQRARASEVARPMPRRRSKKVKWHIIIL